MKMKVKRIITKIQFLNLYIRNNKNRVFGNDEIERNYDIDLLNYLRIKL